MDQVSGGTETMAEDDDELARVLGAERVDALTLAADAMSERMRVAKAAQNAAGYALPFLSADLTIEHVETGLVDRTGWGPGPWDGEPDRVMWAAAAPPHYRCMVSRADAELGHLNGYVAVRQGHPAHGLDCDNAALHEIEVHGGLTFTGRGVEDSWVLGFDCGHHLDVQPGMDAHMTFADERWRPQYKTIAYVRGEVERLAAQLARIAAGKALP
jgi:hypothetical protein